MAAIDKCYTDSLKDYKDFKEWAKDRTYTTPRGCKINVSDIIIEWKDEDFFENGKPKERPIFNSPTHYDNYLYHNCQLQFIQDWLADRYSGTGKLSKQITDIPKLPEYKPCTKVKVIKKGLGNCPFGKYWGISVELNGNICWYNEDFDFWVLPQELDEFTCNHAYLPISVHSIIRRIIRKWKLPIGCRIEIFSGIKNDRWILKTK